MSRISGVYKIENVKNGDFYVGSSVNVNARWVRHKRDMKNGVHGNCHMQRVWDKHGDEIFKFVLIEEFQGKIRELRKREQFFIDTLNPTYNMVLNLSLCFPAQDGENSPRAMITEKDVVEIRRRAKSGEQNISIAKDFPLSPRSISDVVVGNSWKNVDEPPAKKKFSKTKKEDVLKIREMWCSELYTLEELAEKFGIAARNISNIVRFKSFKDVGGCRREKLRGGRKPRIKEEDILNIRNLYSSGKLTRKELSEKYSISMGHLSNIINCKSRTRGRKT